MTLTAWNSGEGSPPWSAGNALPNTAKEAFGLLFHKGTLLALVHLGWVPHPFPCPFQTPALHIYCRCKPERCCPCSGLAYGARLVCCRARHWPRTGRNHSWNGWDCWYLEHSPKSLMRLSTIYQRPGLLPWCPCCWLGSYTISPFVCQSCSWEWLAIRDQTLLNQLGWIADELAIAVGMEAKRYEMEIQSGLEGWDSQLLWAFQKSGEKQGQWLGTSE